MPAPAPVSPDVAKLLATLNHPAEATIHTVRATVLGVDARIGEGIKWNAPSYHLAGAHFATFNLRGKTGAQLVLHLGAKPRPDAKVRGALGEQAQLLEWKSADRAILSLPDERSAQAVQEPLASIVREWIRHL